MFIRFVIAKTDEHSFRPKGLFAAMEILVEQNQLYEYEIGHKDALYNWFRKNLRAPRVQSAHTKPLAISWFKDSASKHIAKMRQYGQILEAHDIHVQQIITERLGKIVYEDKFQIAAIPFSDTF
ncbi:hypothetical protein [Candidatus Albibeggiatoa sp. nov. BB20]|uniref:hypothetical protein n=1 Tax=Candidatus Albibeggiatoa sp. nov. BB20 TaxID=3162723 RepID=UPI00336540D9